jgi:hypothetical protein
MGDRSPYIQERLQEEVMKTRTWKFVCVSALVMAVVMAFCMPSFASTRSPFTIEQDGGDDWRISSLDYKIRTSQGFQVYSRMGFLRTVSIGSPYRTLMMNWQVPAGAEHLNILVYEKESAMFTGPWHWFSHAELVSKIYRAKSLWLAIQRIVGRDVFALTYFADLDEAIIYLHPRTWKRDPLTNARVMVELNRWRAGFNKLHPFPVAKKF